MSRRVYLLLVLLRLYLALSPSYLHPDEHFQGPEVIAGLSVSRLLFFSALIIITQDASFPSLPISHGSSHLMHPSEASSHYGFCMAGL